jgi:indolepyruvate ferredoxin oxidoreductase, beta subunit
MKLEIVCAGVGGRGVLLASTILIETAIGAGYRAMASDEYGMSQRGGSVVSLVKAGDFKSPLIGRENADILLAFEESEFYRNLAFLKRGGKAVVNTGRQGLHEAVVRLCSERQIGLNLVNADGIAKELKMIQASNMAVLGSFARLGIEPFDAGNLENGIKRKVPPKVLEKNVSVFQAGYEASGGKL